MCLIQSIGAQLSPTQPGVMKKQKTHFYHNSRDTFLKVFHENQIMMSQRYATSEISNIHSQLIMAVFYGSRIVIPDAHKKQVLDILHLGHMGMHYMKQLARSAVYWPHIDENISALVRGLTSYAEHQNTPEKAPIHRWILPEKSWSRIHVGHVMIFMGSN